MDVIVPCATQEALRVERAPIDKGVRVLCAGLTQLRWLCPWHWLDFSYQHGFEPFSREWH